MSDAVHDQRSEVRRRGYVPPAELHEDDLIALADIFDGFHRGERERLHEELQRLDAILSKPEPETDFAALQERTQAQFSRPTTEMLLNQRYPQFEVETKWETVTIREWRTLLAQVQRRDVESIDLFTVIPSGWDVPATRLRVTLSLGASGERGVISMDGDPSTVRDAWARVQEIFGRRRSIRAWLLSSSLATATGFALVAVTGVGLYASRAKQFRSTDLVFLIPAAIVLGIFVGTFPALPRLWPRNSVQGWGRATESRRWLYGVVGTLALGVLANVASVLAR